MYESILIIEDEAKIAQLVQDYLEQDGYRVSQLNTGEQAVETVRDGNFDLVLLDLMLPVKDGIQICREIRQFSQVPIFMLTARVDEIDRILGLEIGADDYICKPYSPREVVARVKSFFRRFSASSEVAESKLVEVNTEQHWVKVQGQRLELTNVEFRLMQALAEKPGRIFSRNQLMQRAYDDYRIVTDRAVDTHIKNLRKKIQQSGGDEQLIKSVYGVGYQLNTALSGEA